VLWAQPAEIDRYPLPVTDLKILRFLEQQCLNDSAALRNSLDERVHEFGKNSEEGAVRLGAQ
jgi:hypothetical protein